MKQTITESRFHDEWHNYGRENSFSYAGRKALYEYLTEIKESCETEIELDIVALDCEFCEYGSLEDAIADYRDLKATCEFCEYGSLEDAIGNYRDMEEDEDKEDLRDWFQDRTTLIEFDGGVIIASF